MHLTGLFEKVFSCSCEICLTCSESPLAPPISGLSSYQLLSEYVAVATGYDERCALTRSETLSRWADRDTNIKT